MTWDWRGPDAAPFRANDPMQDLNTLSGRVLGPAEQASPFVRQRDVDFGSEREFNRSAFKLEGVFKRDDTPDTGVAPYQRLAALAQKVGAKITGQGARPPGYGTPTTADLWDISGTQPWRPLIDAQAKAVAQQYGVDPDELADAVHAVMQIESGGRQDAVSGAGAQGLMQVMPFHWAPGTDAATMQDPSNNVRKGAEVLAQNLRAWGDWQRAAAAYFGAIDGAGNITADQDVGGQTGQGYVDQFGRALQSVQHWRQTGRIGGPAAVTPPTVPAGQDLTPDQFGDRQLSLQEAASACGPAAAVAFARYYGRTPTLREATDLGLRNGWWDAQNGMHGPQAQVQLLQSYGLPATFAPLPDWRQIEGRARAGVPTIISTPNHYFVVSAYDPNTGRYFAGNSGTAMRGGGAWLTADDITRLGGQINGVIYAGAAAR